MFQSIFICLVRRTFEFIGFPEIYPGRIFEYVHKVDLWWFLKDCSLSVMQNYRSNFVMVGVGF